MRGREEELIKTMGLSCLANDYMQHYWINRESARSKFCGHVQLILAVADFMNKLSEWYWSAYFHCLGLAAKKSQKCLFEN